MPMRSVRRPSLSTANESHIPEAYAVRDGPLARYHMDNPVLLSLL